MLTKKHIPHCEGEREGRKLPPHTLKGLTKLTKNSKSQAEDTTGRVRLCLHVQSLPDLVCRTAAISALGFCFFFCPGLCFFPSCPGVVAFLRIACICVTIKHSPSCCCRRFLRHYPPFPSPLPSSLFHSHCAPHQRASAKSASVIGLIIIMSPRATGVRTGSPP